MLIKLLKDKSIVKAGDIIEVTEEQAEALISKGQAELFAEVKIKKSTKEEK